ncbi:Cof-type HAD-IIB family hydrolase, partial [Streptococcus agalactiae]|nr:Cof-type HAD-IIB family hydrolase [Streptococcus agalactiae]MCK6289668.1 Cof-type HAD-IIB family hydrolase [Streptococcus agalactiae]
SSYSRSEIISTNQLSKTTVSRLLRSAGARRREISLGTASGLLGSGIIGLGTSRLGQIVSSLVPRKWAKAIERSFKHFIRRIKPQNIDSLMIILREPIYQVVLVATEGESERIQKQFPRVKLTRSSPYSMDVISEEQSKVKGIERVGQRYGFDLSEVIAFGDSDNDIEMLSQVGIGVAMGNASQQVKENARYTTADNNDDGISKALAHYGLIQFEIEKTFSSRDENFNKVKSFHLLMDGETIETPRLYDSKEAGFRSDFKVEEIVEFLYAASQGNQKVFDQSIRNLHLAIDKARDKVISKDHPETPLVGEVDALTDLLYLTYGSFVLMGVDPKPLFDTVHEANMGKIFPDGKAHFDPVTHKILKPDDWEEHFAPEPSIRRELDSQIQKSLNRK